MAPEPWLGQEWRPDHSVCLRCARAHRTLADCFLRYLQGKRARAKVNRRPLAPSGRPSTPERSPVRGPAKFK